MHLTLTSNLFAYIVTLSKYVCIYTFDSLLLINTYQTVYFFYKNYKYKTILPQIIQYFFLYKLIILLSSSDLKKTAFYPILKLNSLKKII